MRVLHSVLPDVIDPVVQALPEAVLAVRVPHEEAVYEDTDQDLDNDLHTEGRHCQYPGAQSEVLPQGEDENCWSHQQESTDSEGLQVTDQLE